MSVLPGASRDRDAWRGYSSRFSEALIIQRGRRRRACLPQLLHDLLGNSLSVLFTLNGVWIDDFRCELPHCSLKSLVAFFVEGTEEPLGQPRWFRVRYTRHVSRNQRLHYGLLTSNGAYLKTCVLWSQENLMPMQAKKGLRSILSRYDMTIRSMHKSHINALRPIDSA